MQCNTKKKRAHHKIILHVTKWWYVSVVSLKMQIKWSYAKMKQIQQLQQHQRLHEEKLFYNFGCNANDVYSTQNKE